MRYVIIGSGNIANTYVRAIRAVGSDVVGVVSRRLVAPSAAPELPTWRQLGEVDKPFDAVCVATPNGLHHQGIQASAALGKPVLCEKPLDITVAAMDDAEAHAAAAGVVVAVAFQRRTAADNRTVKRLLDEGVLGRVFAADLTAKFFRPQSYYDAAAYRGGFALDGGGPFMQQACHNLDIYVWWFGQPVQVVSMLDCFVHRMEAEDHGAALLRHADGMIGTVVASTATQPGFAAQITVHTDKGFFTLTDDAITAWQIDGVADPRDPQFAYHHDGATSAAVNDTRAHEAILRDFATAVATGRQPLANAASARLTTELVLMIYNNALPRP